MTPDLYAKIFFCAIIFALCMFDIFTIEEKYTLKRIMMNLLKSRNMELAWWIKHLPSKPTDHCLDSQHAKSVIKVSWLDRLAKLGSFVFK